VGRIGFLMHLALVCAAILMGLVKVASTIWLAFQPDATVVTATPLGRTIYLSSKISPALFVAAMLALAWIGHAPFAYIAFCAVALIAAVTMAVVVVRQRATGKWYGYLHEIRQRRRP
jgi:hypothetical protein